MSAEAELIQLFEEQGTIFQEVPRCLWRVSDGQVLGGFAWTGYTGETVQMHYVGRTRHWMSRPFLHAAFTYPFDQLKVKVILGFLPADRVHATAVAIKLGFKYLCKVPGVDLNMIAMTRADCKWLALASKRSNG